MYCQKTILGSFLINLQVSDSSAGVFLWTLQNFCIYFLEQFVWPGKIDEHSEFAENSGQIKWGLRKDEIVNK